METQITRFGGAAALLSISVSVRGIGGASLQVRITEADSN